MSSVLNWAKAQSTDDDWVVLENCSSLNKNCSLLKELSKIPLRDLTHVG